MRPRTIALCLDAPMQSWGVRSRGTIRDTASEPTKSGVVGMLGAALGVEREDEERIAAIASMRMGVRVDREGTLERDYHTASDVPTTTGGGHRTVVSERFYLADALFLVVLESQDPGQLAQVYEALQRPRWPIFFGRRAFVPARPLVSAGVQGEPVTGAGLLPDPIEQVLAQHPWLELRPWTRERAKTQQAVLRTILDCDPSARKAELRHDHPISFGRTSRRFSARTVVTGSVDLADKLIDRE